jgi:hypothetical protein
MSHLGLDHTIAETQRHAASLCTDLLRTAIHECLAAFDAAIGDLYGIPPGAENADAVFNASGDVIGIALMTALYVRELTSRPAPRFTRVSLSPN